MKSLKLKHEELCAIIGEDKAKILLHKWYNRVILRERKRANIPTANKEDFQSNVVQIIADLNTRTGLEYRASSKDTQALIKARFNDGFTVEDFKKVHEVKCSQWLHTEQRAFLRPSTLYRPSKFEGYLQEYNFSQNDEKNKTQKKENAKLIKRIEQEDNEEYDPVAGKQIVADLLKKMQSKTKMPGVSNE